MYVMTQPLLSRTRAGGVRSNITVSLPLAADRIVSVEMLQGDARVSLFGENGGDLGPDPLEHLRPRSHGHQQGYDC